MSEKDDEMAIGEEILKTPVKREKIAEDSLIALEKLERASPDLWPEKLPGITDYITMKTTPGWVTPPTWSRGLSQVDINEMHQLGTLTTNGLILEIRNLYDLAYELGLREAREMTHGKYIGIFTHGKRDREYKQMM